MSQTVNVSRSIEFVGDAAQQANIKGDMLPERMTSVDWFNIKAIDTTNDYTGASGSAPTAAGYPGLTLTTSATDNVVYYFATPLIFDVTQNPAIEVKLNIDDVTGTFVFFGFSDAVSETSPAASIDADGGNLTAVATDVAGFVIDADLGSSSIWCASSTDASTIQSVDSGTDWEDGVSHVLRVALDSDTNARFYLDGKQVGYIADALSDVPLCAIVNFGTRDADGANVVYMRYLAKWQDVP